MRRPATADEQVRRTKVPPPQTARKLEAYNRAHAVAEEGEGPVDIIDDGIGKRIDKASEVGIGRLAQSHLAPRQL
jgi:hypothetical protein